MDMLPPSVSEPLLMNDVTAAFELSTIKNLRRQSAPSLTDALGQLGASLTAKAQPSRADRARRAPSAVAHPRDDDARARSAADEEAGLDDREDREA